MRRGGTLLAIVSLCAGACARHDDSGSGDGGLIGDEVLSLADRVLPPGCVPNPSAFDVPGNGCDDDGDGIVDNQITCDDKLPITGDAPSFARAIDLCQTATDSKWGVVSVEYKGSFSTGTPAEPGQHGILQKFGDVVVPRAGKSFGVLSSGWAREFDNPASAPDNVPFKGGAVMQQVDGGSPEDDAPPGFPKSAGSCVPDNHVFDVIDIKLQIKVPTNAQGLQFDFNFWSGEWPDYVCTKYDDAFIAYLTSRASSGGAPDNISFDNSHNPVSVDNGFFDRCTPNSATGCALGAVPGMARCPGGEAELAGTGFDDKAAWCNGTVTTGGGATGWLTSSAPVLPGETITLELMIWDAADAYYDSTVLLDHFTWQAVPTSTSTQRPPR